MLNLFAKALFAFWNWFNSDDGQKVVAELKQEIPVALFDGHILARFAPKAPVPAPAVPTVPGTTPVAPVAPVARPHPIFAEFETILANPAVMSAIVTAIPGGAAALPFASMASELLQALEGAATAVPATATAGP